MSFTDYFQRLIITVVVVLLVWGMWAARGTLLMGFAAALLAVALSILSRRLQRWGLKRGWAVALAVLGGLIVILLLALLVLPRLIQETLALVTSIPDALRALLQSYERLRGGSLFFRTALPPAPTGDAAAGLTPERAREILLQVVDASMAVAPRLLSQLGRLISLLINVVFVLFIAVFFLVDPRSYVQASLYLTPARYHRRVVALWQELYATAVSWMTTLALSISVTVGLVLILLGWLLNMPNAVVVAVFAGLATFIPNIGAFLPLIPITIFALADEPGRLLIYVPVYLAIQFAESNIITPALVRSEMKIPAGALMLFQLLVTLAFGALGLLLAVPLFAILIVLVREVYSYGWLGLRHTALAVHADAEGHLTLVEVDSAASPVDNVPYVDNPRRTRRS